MPREIEYNLVVLSDYKNNKYFVSKVPWFSKAAGYGLLYNFLDFKSKNTGECPYRKLTEYAADKNNMLHGCRYQERKSKEDIEELAYKLQLDLISKYGEDCLLNDLVINPKKYKCVCGQMVHEQFRNAHESKYCTNGKLPSIAELMM